MAERVFIFFIGYIRSAWNEHSKVVEHRVRIGPEEREIGGSSVLALLHGALATSIRMYGRRGLECRSIQFVEVLNAWHIKAIKPTEKQGILPDPGPISRDTL